MKYEMTSKERMLSAIKMKEVDHIPLGQLFHSNILGAPDSMKWKNQFERAEVMKDMGLDPSIDIWLPAPEPPPEIKVRKWKEKDPDGPYPLLCAEYETPAGNLVQKVRQTPDWHEMTHYNFLPAWDGSAHRPGGKFDEIDMMDDWFTRRYKEPLVNGSQDLDKFEHLLKAPSGAKKDEWLKNARRAVKTAADMGLMTHARRISVGDWFMWVCLIEEFCCSMIEDPEYVECFYDIIHRYNKEMIDLILEAGPDLVQYRGWYDTPDYWGKERLGKILAPKIQEYAAMIHEGGSLFCYLLTEGYTHYRDILGKLDVDVYLGLEPLAARKSEDFAIVREALKDHSCIWGGVNAHVTVGTGTDEMIDDAVEYAVRALGPRGFILNASIYIYDDDVHWDRFLKFVKAWRKYAGIQ